jgi:hypothetical protein
MFNVILGILFGIVAIRTGLRLYGRHALPARKPPVPSGWSLGSA